MFRIIPALAVTLVLTACNSAPGPLEGSWQATGGIPLQATFRAGEMETMGIVEKVSYKVDGQIIMVTMEDGMAKGTSVKYVITSPDTMQAMGLTYRKVGQ